MYDSIFTVALVTVDRETGVEDLTCITVPGESMDQILGETLLSRWIDIEGKDIRHFNVDELSEEDAKQFIDDQIAKREASTNNSEDD